MYEIILGIIVFISIILFIFVVIDNQFKLTIIKIDKACEDIALYLDKKKELLSRTKPIVKKELKLEEYMEVLETPFDNYNNFEVYDILKTIYNELFKTLDENEKLMKSDTLLSILDELNANEENIIGSVKFYNDTVVEYNKLAVSFPSNIVALIKRYKKKSFYNNEKREIFNILNTK